MPGNYDDILVLLALLQRSDLDLKAVMVTPADCELDAAVEVTAKVREGYVFKIRERLGTPSDSCFYVVVVHKNQQLILQLECSGRHIPKFTKYPDTC
jgi:hypothetical protein